MIAQASITCLVVIVAAAAARAQVAALVVQGRPGDRAGRAACGIGDVDFDLVPDLVVAAGPEGVEVRAGADGRLLHARSGAAGDDFGAAVARLGDVDLDGRSEILVGAPQIAGGGPGYVQILRGLDGSVIRTVAGMGAGERFGFSVAALPDVTGDGLPDFVAGAPQRTGTVGTNAGSAFVLDGASGALVYRLDALNAGDAFAQSVAAVPDLDGDGVADLLVGAPGANATPGAPFPDGTGTVTVFSGATGAFIRRHLGDGANDQLGWSVAALGDVDGDGHSEYAAGAPGDDDGGSSAGRVFVFHGLSGARLGVIDGPAANARLGESLAGGGDVTGDGVLDVVAGAPGAGAAVPGAGFVVIADPVTGSVHATISGRSVFAALGSSVAVGPDLDGDGVPELVAGAPGAPRPTGREGRAIVYSHRPALGPAAAGNVGAGAGGPHDVLFVNGDVGGVSRRVEIVRGTAYSLSVAQPPGNPSPARFALFARLGAARFDEAVPLGTLGVMAFLPCPVLPSARPFIFTITNNFGAGACGQLVSSAPAPWSVTDWGGFRDAFRVTVQGLIEVGAGMLEVTNGVVIDVL